MNINSNNAYKRNVLAPLKASATHRSKSLINILNLVP